MDELGNWCVHLTFIQNESGRGKEPPWADAFLDWYSQASWLGVQQAACVFIATKLLPRRARPKAAGESVQTCASAEGEGRGSFPDPSGAASSSPDCGLFNVFTKGLK
ncbi:MAG TPA: hypothetical protein VF169_21570 [Albitalea sp.]|uniref:hypothetical protein n=1 Tax=Piscinibacter sp. TaxID=1903157 RepID=UPI002ED10C14